jgi:hypothetical protein
MPRDHGHIHTDPTRLEGGATMDLGVCYKDEDIIILGLDILQVYNMAMESTTCYV